MYHCLVRLLGQAYRWNGLLQSTLCAYVLLHAVRSGCVYLSGVQLVYSMEWYVVLVAATRHVGIQGLRALRHAYLVCIPTGVTLSTCAACVPCAYLIVYLCSAASPVGNV